MRHYSESEEAAASMLDMPMALHEVVGGGILRTWPEVTLKLKALATCSTGSSNTTAAILAMW